jgi:hypothetical protein
MPVDPYGVRDLNRGDFLVDDRANKRRGSICRSVDWFGSERIPDWPAVIDRFKRSL